MKLGGDLLGGAKEIADYMGMTTHQVYHLAKYNKIPAQRIGGKLYARKTELDVAFSCVKPCD